MFVLFELAKYISIRKTCSVNNLNIFHINQVMMLKSLMVKYKRNLLYSFWAYILKTLEIN